MCLLLFNDYNYVTSLLFFTNVIVVSIIYKTLEDHCIVMRLSIKKNTSCRRLGLDAIAIGSGSITLRRSIPYYFITPLVIQLVYQAQSLLNRTVKQEYDINF